MPVGPDQRLRPSERLRLRGDYDRVFAAGCSSGDGVLVVYALDNGLAWSRLGLSVGRRVGPAVRRSLVRRRIREAFRTQKAELAKGYDLVVVAKPPAGQRGVDVAGSFRALAAKAIRRAERKGGSPPAGA